MTTTRGVEHADLPLALVIGGGGMGMATALRLGRTHRVVLASQSAAKNVEREELLRSEGIDAVAIECDVTDPSSVEAMAKVVAERGRLRTLAHVAALSPSMGEWRSTLEVNLMGTALVEQACLDLASPGSAAVFVSSSAGHLATRPADEVVAVLDDPLAPDLVGRLEGVWDDRTALQAYRLSKFGLNRMVRRQATPWGRKGARIVSMSPGPIATPMGERELEGPSGAIKRDLMSRLPLAREGTMDETSDAIEFLVSDKASYITGTDLLVDGGMVAANRPG